MALPFITRRNRRPARLVFLASAALCLGQVCGPARQPAQEEAPEEIEGGMQQEQQETQEPPQQGTQEPTSDGPQQQPPETPQQPPPDELPPPPDEPQPRRGLPPETVRVAFASQCAQNVINCTVEFPVPKISVTAGPNQVVTTRPAGFLVQGHDEDGVEEVQLVGSESEPGLSATQAQYSWSYGAADADPRTLHPGTEFSTEPDPRVLLQEGFHYIRLTVRNDTVIPILESEEFGVLGENVFASDFLEVEIEVQD